MILNPGNGNSPVDTVRVKVFLEKVTLKKLSIIQCDPLDDNFKWKDEFRAFYSPLI